MELFPWQQKALQNWHGARRRGIVEAVTGTGKTMVGIAAIAQMTTKHDLRYLHPLIVVPTQVLQAQWHDRLRSHLPGLKIGLIGQGHRDRYANHDVCIGIINSTVRQLPELFAHLGRAAATFRTFLIADECHHYINAPVFNGLLRYDFDYTLGLSATIRPAVFDHHVQGLGEVVFNYEFGDALKDGLIPPFDIVNCACSFTARESESYFTLHQKVTDQVNLVTDLYHAELRNSPPDFFWIRLRQLMIRADGSEDPIIKKLFILLFKRAALSYRATEKMAMAAALTLQLVASGKKVMVFLERIDDADHVALDAADAAGADLQKRLEKTGLVRCGVYHSQLTLQERQRVLDEFRSKGPKALVSCRSLDEGLDIGDVDCAILAASTQSPRQRIQRIGRVLRRCEGKTRSLIITLYVAGSGDERVTDNDADLFGRCVRIRQTQRKDIRRVVQELLQPPGAATGQSPT